MKAASVVVLFTIFAAFAFGQVAVHAAESGACGPLQTKFSVTTASTLHALPEPEPGKALVYVIEDQKFKYIRDVTARVGLDGEWVGANVGDSYLFFSVSPGEHHLCTDWIPGPIAGRLVSLAPLMAEAGETYYFRARITGGVRTLARNGGLSIDLDRINSDEGKLLVESSALSVSHPKK